MRRLSFLLLLALSCLWIPTPSFAQPQGGGGGGGGQDEDDAKRRKRDQEWGTSAPILPQMRNAGPCPYVKVLYDAARYVEFKDNREASAAVAYSGEIENLSSICAYKNADPIQVQMQVLFSFGRGPEGADSHKTYRYWVAVTDRDRAVLGKEYYDLPVTFPTGADRVQLTETISAVTIPRANIQVSGSNFEVLVGFDVTPAMADFNRQGKRFRANAGQTTTAQTATPPKP